MGFFTTLVLCLIHFQMCRRRYMAYVVLVRRKRRKPHSQAGDMMFHKHLSLRIQYGQESVSSLAYNWLGQVGASPHYLKYMGMPCPTNIFGAGGRRTFALF